jgi:hypothetical protein
MKGIIQSIDVQNNLGIIQGEDKGLYKFDIKDWNESMFYPVKGMVVTFEISDSFSAYSIRIQSQKQNNSVSVKSKSKFLSMLWRIFPLLFICSFGSVIAGMAISNYQNKNVVITSSPESTQPVIPSPEPTKLQNWELSTEKDPNYKPSPNLALEEEPVTSESAKEYITNEGFYATATESDLKKMTEMIGHKDIEGLSQMENAGLIYPVYPNQKVILTGCHGLICSTITFRYEGKMEEHWTYEEAINK